MKGFNDYTGVEGIDKLVECAPYVTEIIKDKKIMEGLSNKTWLEVGAMVYKAHTKACNKMFEILDHKPESSLGLVSATAQIMSEILSDEDTIDFFISAGKSAKSSTSAMESTEDEQ